MELKLLDLFCGAGGAAMGYYQAGFTEIIGVDIVPQPNYPFTFVQGDALQPPFRLDDFDLIHASPPCQAYSIGSVGAGTQDEYARLVEPTQAMLAGLPHVIENVPGSPLRGDVVLCGSMFGCSTDDDGGRRIYLKRHRLFDASFALMSPPDACRQHAGSIAGVYGGGGTNRARPKRGKSQSRGGYTPKADVRRALMDMPWATMKECNEAVPPAYTKYIGEQFLAQT